MVKSAEKRGRGRPPVGKKAMMTPIPVRFPEPMIAEIDALRASRADQPDKGQIIRELVAIGLKVQRGADATPAPEPRRKGRK